MLWTISCIAKPNADAMRARILETHREYLKSQKGILLLSGPTQSDDGTQSLGSLFIINVNSRAEATAFSAAEPFTAAGMFTSVTITRMRKGHFNPAVAESA